MYRAWENWMRYGYVFYQWTVGFQTYRPLCNHKLFHIPKKCPKSVIFDKCQGIKIDTMIWKVKIEKKGQDWHQTIQIIYSPDNEPGINEHTESDLIQRLNVRFDFNSSRVFEQK